MNFHCIINKKIIIHFLFFLFFYIILPSDVLYSQGFGKNKVRYKDFSWEVLKSKHFDIYFEPAIKGLAYTLFDMAEETYEYLRNFFTHDLAKKIPIILFKSQHDFAQTNIILDIIEEGVAGFAEFYKNRVVLPFTGSLKELKETLIHELTHIFTFDILYRGISIENILTRRTPLFLEEGLAEYLSKEELTNFDKALLMDAVINNYLIPIHEFTSLNVDFGYLAYKESQSFIKFLIESYSKERFLLLLENLKKEDNFIGIFNRVYKKDFKDVEREWVLSLRREFLKYADKDFPLLVGEVLSNSCSNFAQSPAGEVIAVYDPIKEDIFLISIKKKKLDHITNKLSKFEGIKGELLDISADGERVVFGAHKAGYDWLIIYDILTKKITDKIKVDELDFITSVYFDIEEKDKLILCGVKDGKSCVVLFSLKTGRICEYIKSAKHYDVFYKKARFIKNNKILLTREKNLHYDIVLLHKNDNFWDEEVVIEGLESYPATEYVLWKDAVVFISQIEDLPAVYLLDLKDYTISKLTNLITALIKSLYIKEDILLLSAFSDKTPKLYKLRPIQTKDSIPASFVSVASGKTIDISKKKDREKLYFSKYTPQLTLDWRRFEILFSSIEGITLFGELSASDILGNHRFLFSSMPSSYEVSNFILYYLYLEKRPNVGLGIFNIGYPQYLDKEKYYKRERGGIIFVEYPIDKFHRHGLRLLLQQDTSYSFLDNSIKEDRGVDELGYSFVVDTTKARRTTGIYQGLSGYFSLEKTLDLVFGEKDYFNVKLDLRRYFPVGESIVLAMRFLTKCSFGKDKEEFYLGGVSVLPFLFDEYEDFRGYKYAEFKTDKLYLVSTELRIPFINELSFSFPLQINNIRGVIFSECGGGSGLSNNYALGYGIRMFLGMLPLRIDWAYRTDFEKIYKPPAIHISLGYDF